MDFIFECGDDDQEWAHWYDSVAEEEHQQDDEFFMDVYSRSQDLIKETQGGSYE